MCGQTRSLRPEMVKRRVDLEYLQYMETMPLPFPEIDSGSNREEMVTR